MANPERDNVLRALCHGADPFDGFPRQLYAVDTQGWNSRNDLLKWSVMDLGATVIVEIGVWKGASVIELAAALKEKVGHGVVIAVDTWLGSPEHRLSATGPQDICFVNGYPQLFMKFMSNVVAAGLEDFVVPFPIDGMGAATCLSLVGIQPDIVHLDAAHEYEAVERDIETWWPVLRDGGIFIWDDYDANGNVWPGVRRAVDEHLARTPHARYQTVGLKARATKLPVGSVPTADYPR